MKIIILAGGFGTRISEESHLRPKPMIEIGDQPILWHIMKSYAYYGYDEFIICCGYKAHAIKEYFADYYMHRSDITFDFANDNAMTIHTMTGGRVKRVQKYIGDEPFMLTYGDGVCDVDIKALENYHRVQGKIATITAVQPGGRFGVLDIEANGSISNFQEKRKEDGGWINGGFMVLEPEIFDLIEGDSTVFEQYPLEECARRSELSAYKHDGFWQCMDTLREKNMLEELVAKGEAPWVKW